MIEQDLVNTHTIERQLNEMALIAGRQLQSKQTGFVHYFYHDQEDTSHTIPIAENVWFVLALFRSKSSEQILEAKELIDRLLHFQNALDGNFPIYIHDYPHCKDKFLGNQLLPAFYIILEEFHTILGSELKSRLNQAANSLLNHLLKAYEEKVPSYSIGLKIAASAKKFGQYWKKSDLEAYGDQLLNTYLKMGLQSCWFVPTHLADICVALQLAYGEIQSCPWTVFWEHLRNTWHEPTKTYIGAAYKQYQMKYEPQPTLYDLFLGYFSKGFSVRALQVLPYHLQAVLIRPTEEILQPHALPRTISGEIDQCRWLIHQEENFAYSLIDRKALHSIANLNAFHPFVLIWGDKSKVHSFVCQGGNFDASEFVSQSNCIEFKVHLSPIFELDEKEKCRELSFFFDQEAGIEMAIEGQPASTFQLGEEFALTTPKMKLLLSISQVDGKGQFLGHVMRGNRSSQICLKGENRFNSYDWNVFVRTLRRDAIGSLKVSLAIQSQKMD